MSRITTLNQRYEACASLARGGASIVVVGDRPGALLNDALWRLIRAVPGDGPEPWDDLVGATKALRWRWVTQPQPVEFNPALRNGAEEVARQVRRLRGAVGDEGMLEELSEAAGALLQSDSSLGGILLRSMEEVGFGNCAVVTAGKPAQIGLESWLGGRGALVLTAGEVERDRVPVDLAYVVGPPRFFRSSLVTAPIAGELSFLMPSWFTDRTVPCSAIAPFAEGALRIEARVFTEGDVSRPEFPGPKVGGEIEEEYLPQPVWGTMQAPDREPANNEVEAKKVLLSGNLATWLDDGDRIRALDPRQPVGERVVYTEVSAVRVGTYLLLRIGETERGALYEAALSLLGTQSGAVDSTQRTWKLLLSERLSELGYREVLRQLNDQGIKATDRARAWTDPNLIRPHSDQDFERLLEWLGIPIQPTFGHATRLRRMLYQASADIREELETAVSAANLSALELLGHMSLDLETEGFRGIVATRVLAISPFAEIVARHDARVLFEDRSGQWLE